MVRVEIKNKKGIIDFPDNYAILKKIENNTCIYDIVYRFNVKKVIENDSYTVLFEVYNTNPEITVRNVIGIDKIIDNILLRRNSAAKVSIKPIISFKSDISSKIPNDLALKIAKRRIAFRKKTKVLITTEESAPLLQLHLFKKQFDNADNKLVKSAYEYLIKNLNIDPSVVFQENNFIVNPWKVYQGIAQQNIKYENKMFNLLLEKIIGQERNYVQQLSPIQKVFKDVETEYLENTETIEVPANLEDFYIVLTLLDKKGFQIDKIINIVRNSTLKLTFNIPKIPPKIVANKIQKEGINTLFIQQQDKNATNVSLYRKIVNNEESGYSLIAKINLNKSNNTFVFVDKVGNLNPVIYRVVAENNDGFIGNNFNSVIVQNSKKILKNIEDNLVLTYTIKENNVLLLEATKIPSNVAAIRFVKRNLSKFQKNFEPISNQNIIVASKNDLLPVTEIEIMENRNVIYEYAVKLIYKNGLEKISTSKMIIEHRPIEQNIIQTVIKNVNVVHNNADTEIIFDIESSFNRSKVDKIKEALRLQGIADFFQDDINKNKELLQKLIAYNIIRINLTTGKIEDFGELVTNTFSDIQFSKVKGLEPLRKNNSYRYIIFTYFRNFETLLETYEKSVKDEKGNEIYKFKPAKWWHPITLTEGSIVNQRTLNRNHSKTDFLLGTLANIQVIEVDTKTNVDNAAPTIEIQKINKNSVLLQWQTPQNMTNVDYFIVGVEIMGMRNVIGKVHGNSNNNIFYFVDYSASDYIGKRTYFAIPVLNNFSFGPEFKSAEIDTSN